jgi:hypothetical protein
LDIYFKNIFYTYLILPKNFMYHKFYIKQMNLELEVVQSLNVQKITTFGHVG